MDYSSPLISLLIVAYGVYEYRRRRDAHRSRMALLRRGDTRPDFAPGQKSWRLMTTGSVCLIFSAFVAALITLGVRSGNNYGGPLALAGLALTVPLLILILIFLRDLRQFVKSRSGLRRPGP